MNRVGENIRSPYAPFLESGQQLHWCSTCRAALSEPAAAGLPLQQLPQLFRLWQ